MKALTANQKKIVLLSTLVLTVGIGVSLFRIYLQPQGFTDLQTTIIPITTPNPTPTAAISTHCVVHVSGAVAQPGVYELSGTARVMDAVTAAGGALAAANLDAINLAKPITDGTQIHIPFNLSLESAPSAKSRKQTAARTKKTNTATAASTPGPIINLNTATIAELDSLPGVGAKMAARILEYRDQHGRFNTMDDLKNVSGIGDAKLAKWEGRVCLN